MAAAPPPPSSNSKPWLGPPLAPARESNRAHYCVCSWGAKCTEIRKILLQRSEANSRGTVASPDPRAGKLRALSLVPSKRKATDDPDDEDRASFSKQKPEIWKRCIETSLGASFTGWPLHKLQHVPVARHHWTRRQNEHFDAGYSQVSKPLTREEIIPLLENGEDDLNETLSLKKIFNRKWVTVYFVQPNVTMESLMSEIAPKLQHLTTAAEVVQQKKKCRQKFNALTYEQYCAKEDELNAQAQELAAAKERQQDLSMENPELRDQVVALEEPWNESCNNNNNNNNNSSTTTTDDNRKRQKI
jgi:hypothetical protein